jgi:thioredoxin 1
METLPLHCPCSGGGEGVHPLVLLAAVASLWLLVRWIKTIWRKKEISTMNKLLKIGIVIALITAVSVIIIQKQVKSKSAGTQSTVASGTAAVNPGSADLTSQPTAKLPRLVDLGAGKCIPCKMMAPILEELKKEYTGRLQVDFIDVWENPDAGKQYGINIIPTQIFYDASGKELFRHEGFFAKEDILSKWKEFGVDLAATKTINSSVINSKEPVQADEKP